VFDPKTPHKRVKRPILWAFLSIVLWLLPDKTHLSNGLLRNHVSRRESLFKTNYYYRFRRITHLIRHSALVSAPQKRAAERSGTPRHRR